MFVNALKIFSWEGRICRRQYLLVFILAVIAFSILATMFEGSDSTVQGLFWLTGLVLIPSQIKRLHDIGWSGWVALLALIPGMNMVLGLGLFLFSGTKGPNKYGEDPHK